MNNYRIFNNPSKLHWYAIEKNEVINKNFSGIDKLMKVMKSIGKDARQSLNLTFSGYDDIPDEIFEIMEIRQFVKVLLQKYPNIFYYLNQEFECLQNIIVCYADFENLFIGERKAINDYPLEDVLTNNLPQQNVRIDVPYAKREHWKKEVTKTGIKYGDPIGAKKVCQDIDNIFSIKI